jgi:hypothetical protein
MWLPVAAASSFVLPATLLLAYMVTAILGARDGAARAFSVAGVLWLMAIQISLVAPLTVAGAFPTKAVALYEDVKCDVSVVPRTTRRWGTGAAVAVGVAGDDRFGFYWQILDADHADEALIVGHGRK